MKTLLALCVALAAFAGSASAETVVVTHHRHHYVHHTYHHVTRHHNHVTVIHER